MFDLDLSQSLPAYKHFPQELFAFLSPGLPFLHITKRAE